MEFESYLVVISVGAMVRELMVGGINSNENRFK